MFLVLAPSVRRLAEGWESPRLRELDDLLHALAHEARIDIILLIARQFRDGVAANICTGMAL